KIVLMGTPQLDGFPQAKAAFVRAAANWEAIIGTPITIVINVDFGPTRFGTPFPQGVIGSTSSQTILNTSLYPSIRDKLNMFASGPQHSSIDAMLPQGSVPPDLGSLTAISAPSSLLRALGFLNATADPNTEQTLGAPPAIGFNSSFNYDFNPD